MLNLILAYLMLFASLFNAVCLYDAFWQLNFSNAFCFQALSWVIDTYFVYFIYYIASCTVLLICLFSSFCVHTVFSERAMCSGEIALKNIHFYYFNQPSCRFNLITYQSSMRLLFWRLGKHLLIIWPM